MTFNNLARSRIQITHGICVAVFVTCAANFSEAQDGVYTVRTMQMSPIADTSYEGSWWHSLWFNSDGYPRYGSGYSNGTRNHHQRLPVRPPIVGPAYGYYQPCWRQLPVARRCQSCETVPSNNESQINNVTPSNIVPPKETANPNPTESTLPMPGSESYDSALMLEVPPPPKISRFDR